MEDDAGISRLKRRNSVPSAVLVPPRQKTSLENLPNGHHTPPAPSSSVSDADFELVSLKFPAGSYMSLKDLIPSNPSSILSPTPAAAGAAATAAGAALYSGGSGSGYEISIRNRLVKQAAWAYLQPAVSSSPSSSSRRLCFSGEFLRPMIAELRKFVVDTAIRVYDWLVDALWLILCR